ncbi:MAG: Gfo/Idh/MocA family oxidoreductase [Pirellula sp.]
MDRPRIGVIGGGHLGRIHAKLAASNPDCNLVGVADPSSDSRHLVESQLGLNTISEFRDWLGDIDGAIIAAPTFLHHEIGLWCLRHDIHLFVEKPIASSLRQANELVQLANAHNRTLQVGHVERFNPAWREATDQLSESKVHYIEASREGTYTGRSTDIGVVMDLMIHDIDLILSAIDSPIESVQAYGWSVLGEHEDFAVAMLKFRSGALAHLRASRISPISKRFMQIYSECGSMDIDFAAGTVLSTVLHRDVAMGNRRADQLSYELRAKVKDSLFQDWLCKTETKPPSVNAIQQEQEEFISAIRESRPVTVGGTQACNALELASRILEQIELQQAPPDVIPMRTPYAKPKAA